MAPQRRGDQPVRSMALDEFVGTRPASARLRNSLGAAALARTVPFATVGDYLASPEPQQALCAAVRNFGRGTANELDRLIRRHAEPSAASPEGAAAGGPKVEGVDRALASFRGHLEVITFREFLRDVSPTSRVMRALSAIGDRPAWEVMVGLDGLAPRLLRLDGVGRTTLDELSREVGLAASRLLDEAGSSVEVRDEVMAGLFEGADAPTMERSPGPGTAASHQTVREVLDGITILEAFGGIIVPVRLARVVQAPRVAERALADAILDRRSFESELLSVRTIGRKTIDGFWAVCWQRLASRLERAGVDAGRRQELAAWLGSMPGSSRAVPTA